MSAILRIILWDQLSETLSCLKDTHKNDIVALFETKSEATFVRHHRKKIAFLFSAMRHFRDYLKKQDLTVDYVSLDDPENSQSLEEEIHKAITRHGSTELIITHPSEYHSLQMFKRIEKKAGIKLSLLEDDRFLSTQKEFNEWAGDKKHLRMEYFYRIMRLKHNILIDKEEPIGGKWNYDKDNRKPPEQGLTPPSPLTFEPDNITSEVITLVEKEFNDHFGDLKPFYFAVTRADALKVLEKFIDERLPLFGDYQDAMVENEPWMYHSHLSFYINCGLLLPLECIKAAVKAYETGKAPLNSVEGFVRQILGWREYIKGLYWLKMPTYKNMNSLEANRPLPNFFWTGQTKLNCLKQCISETKRNAYAHHIQRLMVLGNFCLLTGIHPDEVNEWYHIVYADAYEWVELPNVIGMILFADDGFLASKPYAASGAYINKMSNYCDNCHYDVKEKTGDKACPFNYLYWNFLIEKDTKLRSNHRMRIVYSTLEKMTSEKKEMVQSRAKQFLKSIEPQTN